MLVLLIILVMKLLFGGVQASKNKHKSATKWFLIETKNAQNSRGLGKGHLKTFIWSFLSRYKFGTASNPEVTSRKHTFNIFPF